ncbi:MAG: EamA family transporter [Candidatus Eisenbacteria bacterium]|nr:EamA family transporter [Candidatus Eisenbacteria bacterium]
MSGDETAAPAADRDACAGPWLAFAGCSAILGSTFLVISVGNDALAPVWASAVRLVLAAILLGIWCKLARIPFPRGDALKAAAAYGVFNFGLNFPLLYWGEKSVPSGLSAVMFSTIPLTTALLTRALGMERLTPAKLIGALIALAGVGVLFSGSFRGEIAPLGLLAVLSAATIAAIGATLLKRGPQQNPIGANAAACAIGAVIALGISFAVREAHVLPLTMPVLFPLLYLTIAGSLGAFVLFAWLIHHWPITRATYISVVVPLIALALGTVVRHERLTVLDCAGSAIVIAGLVIGMRGAAKSGH